MARYGLVAVEENHQATRITIRQWSEQDAIHDGKDCRRRANAERQGQNRHTRERGLASQQPPGMTQVPKKQAQHALLDGLHPSRTDAQHRFDIRTAEKVGRRLESPVLRVAEETGPVS